MNASLSRIGKARLIIGAILIALGGLLMLPDDPTHYASPAHPAADSAEAVRRVERLHALEVGFNPDCHTTLLTHGSKTVKAMI